MTWVDIANLRGPQGDQGPVNVGLRQTDPITYAAPGGFTFNLADGGQQTVNIPLATAQSAGLFPAGTAVRSLDQLIPVDQGWAPELGQPRVSVVRSGPVVMVVGENFGRSSPASGYVTMVQLPVEYRPVSTFYGSSWRAKARVTTDGLVQLSYPGTALDYLSVTFISTAPISAT